MSLAFAWTVAAWIWIASGVGIHGLMIYLHVESRDDDDYEPHLGLLVMGLAASGLVVSGAIILGFASAAVWLCRASGGLLLLIALWANARKLPTNTRVFAILNLVVAASIFAL